MSGLAPLVTTIHAEVDPVTIAADSVVPVAVAPWVGTLTAVSYEPIATITGVATNNRTLSLINRGAADAGTTVMASLAFTSGAVVATIDEDNVITLSATPANLVVAAGDVLVWSSVHVGTGIVDPGGRVVVTLSRT